MKNFNPVYVFGLAAVMAGCTLCNAGQSNIPPQRDSASLAASYSLVEAFPNLKFDDPVELTSPNDNTDRIFLVAQKGKIHLLPNNAEGKDAPVFLDIVSKVESGGEKGLLGLAFHPDFKT